MIAPDRRAIAAWCLYDWANSAYNTVITTFVFAVYFTRAVARDEVLGTAAWSRAMAAAGLAVAILSPVLGAVADHTGRRKPWLALFTALTVAFTTALWWVKPDPSSMALALVCVALGTIAFELANVFYNASLPAVAPPSMFGRVSGWGWGTGYFGGLACLIVALFGFVNNEAPVFGLFSTTDQENVRATALLVAAWFGLFSLPLFLWVPDEPGPAKPLGRAVREGLATLWRTIGHARQYRQIGRFLIASAFYRDAINTITAFGGIYAAGTFGMSFEEIVLFAIVLNVVAGLGAVGFAWIDDWFGARRTILISVAGLIVSGVPLILATDKTAFWVLALGLGLFFGPAQAAGRSMMARLSPEHMQGEMFGLYGLSGRVVGFFGPLALGFATEAFASQRAGMASILVFFAVGFVLMLGVRDPLRPTR
ncbi:MFS transporter [Azospirillum sp.]|uniref:MFS transporter n=1 Tax=Azospirillum sp. TaxID=34012 RepID=UPI002D4FD971|nr:MFS transporter [Azospirillum sp.]HYD70640.1 MFS transporter [Azospirillum sp.]